MKSFPELLQFAVDQEASDLHMSSGSIPMIRVHGRMRKLNLPAPTTEEMEEEIQKVLEDIPLQTEGIYPMSIVDSEDFR